jgi:replicative DNA helicase
VAARPSVGKTSLMLGMARNMARDGTDALVCSLEVPTHRLVSKMVGWHAGTSPGKLERSEADEGHYQRAGTAPEAIPARLYVNDSVRTVPQVYAEARKYQSAAGVKVVFIDYLQLIVGTEHAEDRQREVAIMSRELKQMAKDLNVAIVALSQLSRASEARRDKRPQLADLRESGALEQDADMVLLPFRPEMHSPKPEHRGVAEAIVAKNRDGATGVVRMAFVAELSMFADLAVQEEA